MEQLTSGENIESVVMKNLYSFMFVHPSEKESNEKIEQNILLHQQFIKPEHLELPVGRLDFSRIEQAGM